MQQTLWQGRSLWLESIRLPDFVLYTIIDCPVSRVSPQCESKEDLQLLAVTQPSAKGQSYIPGTHDEVKCIKQHAKGKVPVLWLDENMATTENVQKGMKESRWVHFACHGVQSTSPTESALLLAGSLRLTLSNIIELSLPNADLAFLSACQTATGSKDLQDESVHLTAGMLLAGYRGVIGTMWSITDNDAPQVASDVYAYLLEHHLRIQQEQLRHCISPFGSFESSPEKRNHFYTGCPSYILGFNLGDILTKIWIGIELVAVSVGPLVSYSLDFIQWSVRGYKLQPL
ncbi:CHAT domain-containing protein [Mycena galopus ATCC 62051]|nr:CHAT domain-containing protein [Mycena galopus ATCC 62051]